jgi:hypothetical protein
MNPTNPTNPNNLQNIPTSLTVSKELSHTEATETAEKNKLIYKDKETELLYSVVSTGL